MVDLAGLLQLRSQCELAFQNVEGAFVELYDPILAGLRPVLVPRHDTGLRDTDGPFREIAVVDQQRDLFGRTQTGEESKLVIVALCLAPLGVDGRDHSLRLIDAEGVDRRPIFLGDAQGVEP